MKTQIEFPGYVLTEARRYYLDGDQIALPYETRSHGTLYSFYTFGSAAGFAIRNGDDPEETLARARANGHRLHWLNLNATVIHSGPRERKSYPLQMWGDVVRFHGRNFQIVKDRYSQNAFLVEVEG